MKDAVRAVWSFLAILVVAVAFGFAIDSLAQAIPPNPDPSVVAVDAQAAIVGSSTSCANISTLTTPEDVWDYATGDVAVLPTLAMVRYVEIQNVSDVSTSNPFTARLLAVGVGGDGTLPNNIATGKRVMGGQGVQFQVRRPSSSNAVVGGTWPAGPIPIYLWSSNADVCITFYW